MNSKIEHDDNYGCAPFSSKEIEALRNLRENPAFQLVGIGNPTLYDDPHMVFVEPKSTMETENPRTVSIYPSRFGTYRSASVGDYQHRSCGRVVKKDQFQELLELTRGRNPRCPCSDYPYWTKLTDKEIILENHDGN